MELNIFLFWILLVIGLGLVTDPNWGTFFKVFDFLGFSSKMKGKLFSLGIAEPIARWIGVIIIIFALYAGRSNVELVCKAMTICS